ncbi:MAG: PKD domain-containing protein [Flavobacteriaceae bacterium]|nr:PKD domain-containing protein [Flavobacteriaceae bacterium]
MGHIDGTSSNMSLYITSDVNTSGTVAIPGKSWSTTFGVTANAVTVVSIPQSLAYMNCSDCILAQGIHITANDPVVVYGHIYANARSDATLVLPTPTAGREYYAQSFTQKVTGSNRQNEFMVIGLEDSTYVDITPAAGTLSGTHTKGITYSKLLMQGEIYQVQSDSDLTGSHIVSSNTTGKNCKRIAVFSGSSFTPLGCTSASSGDNLFQQIYPVSAWGKTYATAPMKTRKGGDYFRILASKSNTQITINGWNNQTIGAGQYYEWLSDSAQYITSTEPVQMAQYQRTQNCDNVTGDPSMIILNSAEQQLDDITLYSSPYQNITGNYINVLMESDDTSSFTLDGNKVSWSTIPSNSGFAYTQTTVNSGNHRLTADSGFNAIAYGFGNVESYGYSAGANIVNLVQSITVYKYASTCKGVPLQLTGNCIYTPIAWRWDFGDGGSDTVQNPKHTFSDTGDYLVSLVTMKNNGNDCESQDSTIYTVHIYPLPTSSFTFDAPCSNAPVQFQDSSSIESGSITLYTWDFGDTTSSNSINPSHAYSGTGTRRVILAVTSKGNCYGRDTQNVTIQQSSVPNFYFTQKCMYDSIAIADSSTLRGQFKASYGCYKSIVRWGDGNTDTIFNVIGNNSSKKHDYTSAGSYAVKMVGMDCSTGCIDSVSKSLDLQATPIANFVITNGCEKDSLTIIDSSSISFGSILSWSWNFGDNTTQTYTAYQSSVKKRYTTSGTYLVTLVVVNTNGCKDTFSKNILVHPKPIPLFATSNVCYPEAIPFSDTSSISSGSIVQRQWFWGDGLDSTFGQTDTSVKYSYSVFGTYAPKLVLVSDNGCKDSLTGSVSVWAKPNASFSVSNGCQLASLGFVDNSTIGAQSISKRFWDFGNGDTATKTSTSFNNIFADTGTYTITLTTTSSKGCTDTIQKQIIIYPKPLARIYPQPNCSSDTLLFYDSSSVGYGSISKWGYTWGDAKTTTYTTATNPARHKYTLAGKYAVTLIVTTNNSCTDTTTDSVQVYTLPKANFTTANLCLNQAASFTNNSTIGSTTLQSWNWDFGDGNADSLGGDGYVEHQYSSSGSKFIKLLITDAYGCKANISKFITIEVVPNAAFTYNTACVYDSLSFTNSSSISNGSIALHTWKWGDTQITNTASSALIRHKYASSGYKTVDLLATSNKGCFDTATLQLYVKPKPNIAADLPNICFKDSVYFMDLSSIDSGSLTSWVWVFGDGGGSVTQHAAHKYDTVGAYPVKLVVNSSWGCKDSLFKQFTVNSNPVAGIGVSSPCLNDSVQLIDSTTMAFGSVYRWHWQIGDGDTSDLQNPKHKYADTGMYTLKLHVQSGNLCKDSVTKQVRIYLNPVAKFSVLDICFGDSSSFVSTTTSMQGNLLLYSWLTGNGDSIGSSSAAYKYMYSSAGNYFITHIATAATTCTDTISKSINVWPKPLANFAFVDVCKYDSLRLNDSSKLSAGSIVSWRWGWGDGNVVTKSQPVQVSHLYANAGSYPITLLVTSDKGCMDTLVDSVAVNPVPIALFSVNQYIQCFNRHSFTLTDTSAVAWGGYTRSWELGDGSVDTSTSFAKNYSSPDTFYVKIKITSDQGCIDSITKDLTINPSPKAAILLDTNSLCLSGNSFSLADSTTISTGNYSVLWDLGDTSVSTQKTIAHTYAHPDTFMVQLKATSSLGCADSITDTLVVHPMPVADFTFKDVCAGDTFTLNDKSTISSGNYLIQSWFFNGLSHSPSSVYKTLFSIPHTDTVYLFVNSNFGCFDIAAKAFTIHPYPVSSVYLPNNCLSDSSFIFDSTGILFGSVDKWGYDFGDSSATTLRSGSLSLPIKVSHQYKKPGIYLVNVAHISQFGCTEQSKHTITIHPQPEAKLIVPDVCLIDSAKIIDSSSIATGSIVNWDYLLGDGSGLVSSAANITHKYTSSGSYYLQSIPISNFGCRDTAYDTVIIHPHPVVNFVGVDACAFDSTSFLDFSTIPFDTINQQIWNFGDSAIQSFTKPFSKVYHSYVNWGKVPVTLTLLSDFGCANFLIDTIDIYPLPQPKFIVPPVCFPDTIQVFDISTIPIGSIVSWDWSWGDGHLEHYDSAIIPLTHSYTSSNDYSTRLVVVSDKGCVSSFENTAIIHPLPKVKFEADKHRDCPPLEVQFMDKSTLKRDSIIGWDWSFGDGDVSLDKNAWHRYPYKEYLYLVKLKITTNAGCTDSLTDTVPYWVNAVPTASFVPNYDSVSYLDPQINFINTSKYPQYSYWTFGDGTEAYTRNVKHTYVDTGRYNVRLIVTNAYGCKDTARRLVFVAPDYTFYVPNSFTPNGDFLNETWGPEGIFVGIRTYKVRVWNRWGEKVFETTDLLNKWNGNYQNSTKPGLQDVYFYRIDLIDFFYKRHHQEGMIHLIR